MTEAEHLARCHPWLASRVGRVLGAWRSDVRRGGDTIRLVESVRDLQLQRAYHARGASRHDGVSTYSLHQFAPALAVDCVVIRRGGVVRDIADPAWVAYGELAEAEGLEWGGRWPSLRDGPHIQTPLADRVRLVQLAAGVDADGRWGPATDAAVARRVELRAGRAGWARMSLAGWAALVSG